MGNKIHHKSGSVTNTVLYECKGSAQCSFVVRAGLTANNSNIYNFQFQVGTPEDLIAAHISGAVDTNDNAEDVDMSLFASFLCEDPVAELVARLHQTNFEISLDSVDDASSKLRTDSSSNEDDRKRPASTAWGMKDKYSYYLCNQLNDDISLSQSCLFEGFKKQFIAERPFKDENKHNFRSMVM